MDYDGFLLISSPNWNGIKRRTMVIEELGIRVTIQIFYGSLCTPAKQWAAKLSVSTRFTRYATLQHYLCLTHTARSTLSFFASSPSNLLKISVRLSCTRSECDNPPRNHSFIQAERIRHTLAQLQRMAQEIFCSMFWGVGGLSHGSGQW
jgi:hypothetical protein